MKIVRPYEKVHLIYDHLMKHVDYKDWAEYIDEIVEHHGIKGVELLDVACGSGSFLPHFYEMGYDLTAVELSEEMILQAKEKVEYFDDIQIFQQDMTQLSLDKTYDVVVCLFDSVNYLPSSDLLVLFFNHIAKVLKPEGIFIFDVATQYSCKRHFGNFTENGTVGSVQYNRRCTYSFQDNIQTSVFTLETDDETFKETHQQRIYSIEEIERAIQQSGLRCIATHGDFDLDPIDAETERAHFVLKH